MTFGEKIRAERAKLGMDQQSFAEKIGVSKHSLSDYETGKALPRTRDSYRRIADALGVHINYLLTESDDASELQNAEFIAEAGEKFGYRGKKGAQRVLAEVNGLFAGGEMAEEDKDELMLAIQQAYIDAKKRNKKFTPKKYRVDDGETAE